MKIDNRWIAMLAIVAIAATAVSVVRRRHRRTTRVLEHKRELGNWESEGGNLAPAAVAPPLP